MDIQKLKDIFELATVFFKTLVKLFAALEVGTDEKGNATYYKYLDIVHDGAEKVLDSKEFAEIVG